MSIYQEIESILRSSSIVFILFFAFFGACIASFFNVVILRYQAMTDHENATEVKEWFEDKKIKFPEELEPLLKPFNIAFPASHCSTCKNSLKWYHNIPVLSFLFLRAKCGFCNASISWQYPIVEICGAILLSSIYVYYIPYGLTSFLIASVFFMSIFILFCLDFKCFLLPDTINYFLLWLGILTALNQISFTNLNINSSIYGAVAGYLLLYFIALGGKFAFKKEAMGNGDFKLMAALGAFIGVKGVFFTVFASPFIGIPTYIIFKLLKKNTDMIPYGPSLILAAILYMFWGQEILKYLNILI